MATYDQNGYRWPDFNIYGPPQYSGPYAGPNAASSAGASAASGASAPGSSVNISLNSDGTVSGIPMTWLMIGLGLFLMLLVRR